MESGMILSCFHSYAPHNSSFIQYSRRSKYFVAMNLLVRAFIIITPYSANTMICYASVFSRKVAIWCVCPLASRPLKPILWSHFSWYSILLFFFVHNDFFSDSKLCIWHANFIIKFMWLNKFVNTIYIPCRLRQRLQVRKTNTFQEYHCG